MQEEDTELYELLENVTQEQVLDIVRNLKLRKLVDPFHTHRVDGRLLMGIEAVQDLTDIDPLTVKPIFARALYSELSKWKRNGGRVPRHLLNQAQSRAL